MHELDKMGLEAAVKAHQCRVPADAYPACQDFGMQEHAADCYRMSEAISAYLSTTSAGVTEEQTQTALHNAKVLIRALSGPDDAIAQACIAEIEAALEASRVAPVSQKEAVPVVTPRYGYSCYACRAMTPPAFDMEKAERFAAEANWQLGTDFDGQANYACPTCAAGLFNVRPLRPTARLADLEAFHGEVWGWLLKRGLVSNEDIALVGEWRGFVEVIEEHEDEIVAGAKREALRASPAPAVEPVGIKANSASMPEEPNEAMLRVLFELNSGPRNTGEVIAAYKLLRNLVALHPSPTPVSAPVELVEAELVRKAKAFDACDWYWPEDDTSSDACADNPFEVLENCDALDGEVVAVSRGGVVETRFYASLPPADDSDSDDTFDVDEPTQEAAEAKITAERDRRSLRSPAVEGK